MQIVSIRQFAWNVKTFFSEKNKKNIINLSSAVLAQGVIKVKGHHSRVLFLSAEKYGCLNNRH